MVSQHSSIGTRSGNVIAVTTAAPMDESIGARSVSSLSPMRQGFRFSMESLEDSFLEKVTSSDGDGCCDCGEVGVVAGEYATLQVPTKTSSMKKVVWVPPHPRCVRNPRSVPCDYCKILSGLAKGDILLSVPELLVIRDQKDEKNLGHFLVIPKVQEGQSHSDVANHAYDWEVLKYMHVAGIVVAAVELAKKKKEVSGYTDDNFISRTWGRCLSHDQ